LKGFAAGRNHAALTFAEQLFVPVMADDTQGDHWTLGK
jgi:hypothetical protein